LFVTKLLIGCYYYIEQLRFVLLSRAKEHHTVRGINALHLVVYFFKLLHFIINLA